jgi:mono/diheme cytochrome c family protein
MMIMKNIKSGIYKIGSLILLFLLTSFFSMAQDFAPWPAPDDAAAVQNPIPDNKASLEAGKALYNIQCKACHGETGKGDGLIKAASFYTENFQNESDGAIFWKLQQGRGQMPGFKALPEEQLWNVVNYIRSFTKKRDGLIMKDAVVSLYFNENGEQKELTTKVEQVNEDGTKIPASGILVNLGVQMYFGIQPITGTANRTNEKGELKITFPNNMIGDENGDLTVIASIEDMEYNPAQASEAIAWGSEKPQDYWTERRALWKNNEHVPIWLMLTFIGGALGIWLTIMYVALLVRKIKIEGDK